jgi:endonuclease/exonuclease/phosphatase family metal-dependent hydrolase
VTLRIATFNVENLGGTEGVAPALSERLRILRPQLHRLRADVLCLQEVNAEKPDPKGRRRLDALDRLLDGTPYAGYARAVTTRRDGGDYLDVHNLVILSRLSILETRQIWHDLVPPPLVQRVTAAPAPIAPEPVEWDRPVLHALVELGGGRRLHVLNLHLRAPLAAFIPGQKIDAFTWRSVAGWAEGFYLAAIKRTGQACEARLAVDRIFDTEGEPLIALCGDFNATERETPMRAAIGASADTGNGRLIWREIVPLEHSLPEDRRYSVVHGGAKVMLDHILVSRPLLSTYRGAEIHNEALSDELIAFATPTRSPESFHAPVVAEFDL